MKKSIVIKAIKYVWAKVIHPKLLITVKQTDIELDDLVLSKIDQFISQL